MVYRRTRNYENLQIAFYSGVGRYDMPALEPTEITTKHFLPFNYASSIKETACDEVGIHFFLDDYQFQRIWTEPVRYVNMLRRFSQVLTPDFSMYADFPIAIQIYNHYRRQWFGKLMQDAGIDVIPTVSWSTQESYSFCFDGIPQHAAVAVSSVGTRRTKEARQLFLSGYNEMLSRLEPQKILFAGAIPEGCNGNIVKLKAFQDIRFKK